mmetsp:Transcript_19463/g.45290  ORF Transcript_19463/g.45290 Transcript_19463/m.45290 type:complete len:101 (+) Transcript_19463:366-668(+)
MRIRELAFCDSPSDCARSGPDLHPQEELYTNSPLPTPGPTTPPAPTAMAPSQEFGADLSSAPSDHMYFFPSGVMMLLILLNDNSFRVRIRNILLNASVPE